jgi:hypothetical protein
LNLEPYWPETKGLHRLPTVCIGCNLSKASETYVNVGFISGVREWGLAKKGAGYVPGRGTCKRLWVT